MSKQIPLSRGHFATVDDADYEYLMQWKWYSNAKGYAHKVTDGKSGFMHRILLGVTDPSLQVDHINGDRRDNRRENLRVCTCLQNRQNQKKLPNISGYKGVHWVENRKKWRAKITVNKKMLSLGSYTNRIDAARAYDAAARKYFGQFARVNFPLPGEQSALT